MVEHEKKGIMSVIQAARKMHSDAGVAGSNPAPAICDTDSKIFQWLNINAKA